MIRPDAIPVRPVGSRAVLPPEAVADLFGPGATLRANARVEVVRLGVVVATVPVETGAALDLRLGAFDADAVRGASGLRLRGPVGAVPAPLAASIPPRLLLPDGLRRAWGTSDSATIGLFNVAITVRVASGPEAAAEIDHALWLAAGRPEVARWLPSVDLAAPTVHEAEDDRTLTLPRRVVTETDVRQARLKGKRIRLGAGQIVTPAARSLGREWDLFEARLD